MKVARRIPLPFLWWFDRRDDVWKFGDRDNCTDGIGVFKEQDGKWYGNIVVAARRDITGIGPYNTSIEAMSEAEIMYIRIKALPI